MDLVEARAQFPGLKDVTYLNTASVALGSTPAVAAYEGALAQWRKGSFNFVEGEEAADESRRLFAGLINADPAEVAVIPTVSASAGIVAEHLGTAAPGDNVLVADLEFASNFFPWLQLRDRGFDVRVVPSVGGAVPTEAFAALADDRTRLIAVSAVQSATGFRADIPALARLAHASGGLLFVDAAQAAGGLPIDVARDGIDFLAAPSHKFLLSTRGMGYLFVRRDLVPDVRPVGPGWRAASRPLEHYYGPKMELSETASKLDASITWFAALADRAALGLLHDVGARAVHAQNAALTAHLHDALADRGVAFDPFPVAHRSPVVSVPVAEPDAVLKRLRDGNIVASMRAGRLRVSVHFYNTTADVDRVVDVLAA